VTASQAGDAVYLPATPVTLTFTIKKSPQVIEIEEFEDQDLAETQSLDLTFTSESDAPDVVIASATVDICEVNGYSITFLAEGDCKLTFTKAGYATEVVGVSLSSSLGAATSNVVLQKSASSITGVIASSTGNAVSGATIVATSGLVSLSTLSTDPSGAFRIDGLASGWWTVTVSSPGYSNSVVLIQVGITDQDLGPIPITPVTP
jgi:hypothetical protein